MWGKIFPYLLRWLIVKRSFLSCICLLLLYQLILLYGCEDVSAQLLQRGRITGKMKYTYTKSWHSTNGFDSNSRSYSQDYNLGFSGFIWDYRFMSFDSYLGYSDYGTNTPATDGAKEMRTNTDLYEYGFRSTILSHPRFKFPLTFFASKDRTESTGNRSASRTIETKEDGIKWVLKFVKLPETKLNWRNRTRVSNATSKTKTKNFGLSMDKRIEVGRTVYGFHYRGHKSIGRSSNEERESNSKSFTGTAYTRFSSTASFNQGVNYLKYTSSDNNKFNLKGYRAYLSVQPTDSLSNSLSYNYTQTSDEELNESTNHAFSANTSYTVNPRLTLSNSLGYGKSTFVSPDNPKKVSYHNVSIGANFRLTERTNTHIGASYNKSLTLLSDSTVKSVSKGANAGISYSRPLKWFLVGGSYNVGINDINRFGEEEGSSGSSLREGTLLSHQLALFANSRGWRFLQLTSKYEFTDRYGTSTREEDKERSHHFRVDVSSGYFRNTVIYAYADKFIKDTYPDLKTDTTQFNIKVRHHKVVWRGFLTTDANYNRSYSFNQLIDTSKSLGGNYRKILTRNLSMTIQATLSDTSNPSYDRTSFEFVSKFQYRLRAWLVSFEYDYRTHSTSYSDSQDSRTTENRIYITLTRRFGFAT